MSNSGLFAEPSGQLSSMRLLTAFVVVAVVGTWSALSLLRGEFLTMSPDQVGLVLGALGLKGWQRGKEGAER